MHNDLQLGYVLTRREALALVESKDEPRDSRPPRLLLVVVCSFATARVGKVVQVGGIIERFMLNRTSRYARSLSENGWALWKRARRWSKKALPRK